MKATPAIGNERLWCLALGRILISLLVLISRLVAICRQLLIMPALSLPYDFLWGAAMAYA